MSPQIDKVDDFDEELEKLAINYSLGWGENDDAISFKAGYKAAQPKKYSIEDIGLAFDAGREHEYDKHFGVVPTLSKNKTEYINSLK